MRAILFNGFVELSRDDLLVIGLVIGLDPLKHSANVIVLLSFNLIFDILSTDKIYHL